jgi:aminoglycoside phosphotransferase family enzyme
MDPNPAGLIDAFSNPGFYHHPVAAVQHRQTHISHVFLTGLRAFKIKKPVDFGFLDFTTLDKRRHFLHQELVLNRRLCPEVYLEVIPVTEAGGSLHLGGEGRVVEHALAMLQMDESRLMNRLFEAGEVGPAQVEAVAEVMVPFYETAATGGEIDRYGRPEVFRINTDENFVQIEPFIGGPLTRKTFEAIRAYTDRFLEGRAEVFERRIARGRIRDGHGDLHMGNIILAEKVHVFDCIEFNDRFRYGDVAVDLGFLAMDLDFHGRRDLSARLMEVYVQRSGDADVFEVLDFYKCYRAVVRGKIAGFTADGAAEPAQKQSLLDTARAYFNLARAYAGRG